MLRVCSRSVVLARECVVIHIRGFIVAMTANGGKFSGQGVDESLDTICVLREYYYSPDSDALDYTSELGPSGAWFQCVHDRSNGRSISIEGPVELQSPSNRTKHGGTESQVDHMFHLIAKQFGGPDGKGTVNVVDGHGYVNTHGYRNVERAIGQLIADNGPDNIMRVECLYERTNNTNRPDDFLVVLKNERLKTQYQSLVRKLGSVSKALTQYTVGFVSRSFGELVSNRSRIDVTVCSHGVHKWCSDYVESPGSLAVCSLAAYS